MHTFNCWRLPGCRNLTQAIPRKYQCIAASTMSAGSSHTETGSFYSLGGVRRPSVLCRQYSHLQSDSLSGLALCQKVRRWPAGTLPHVHNCARASIHSLVLHSQSPASELVVTVPPRADALTAYPGRGRCTCCRHHQKRNEQWSQVQGRPCPCALKW